MMMQGMKQQTVRANGIRLNVWTGGKGRPLLLIHGYPQTAIMWRKIVLPLMEEYMVVCPDLRGYGASEKPQSGYDKKTMAKDMKLLMEALGFNSFLVVGHDRGGRVGHRLALDHPECVEKLCLLDIVPTHTVLDRTEKELARDYWHWYFFQVPDLPEMFIQSNVDQFMRYFLKGLTYQADAIDEEALQEYIRAFQMPGTIRATLQDYRDAAAIDFQHDEEDLEKKVECPMLVLWGKYGKMHDLFDVLETWKEKATSVSGRVLSCGHFIPEELPEELLEELHSFL